MYFWSYLAQFFLELKMCQNKVVEKIKRTFQIQFFFKSCRLWNKMEEYCRIGQAEDDSMAHAHCMLDTKGYKHALRIRNIYCSPTATRVARTRLNVKLHSDFLTVVIPMCLSNSYTTYVSVKHKNLNCCVWLRHIACMSYVIRTLSVLQLSTGYSCLWNFADHFNYLPLKTFISKWNMHITVCLT